jgi:hypothetical protein
LVQQKRARTFSKTQEEIGISEKKRKRVTVGKKVREREREREFKVLKIN